MSTEQTTLDFNKLTPQQLEQLAKQMEQHQENVRKSKFNNANVENDLEGLARVKEVRNRINDVIPEPKLINTNVIPNKTKSSILTFVLIAIILALSFMLIQSKYNTKTLVESNNQLQYNYKHQQENFEYNQAELNKSRSENARLKKYDYRYDDLAQRLSAEQQEVDRLRAENSQLQTTLKKMDRTLEELDTKYSAELRGHKNEIKRLESINDDYDTYYKLEKRIKGEN